MRPHHRAQLVAAVAQFLADIRRLARAQLRGERDRLLAGLEPSRTHAAATATLQRPARRARAAATGPSRGPAIVGRRAWKASAAKPAKSGRRRSTATRPAPEPATAPSRQVRASVIVAGPPPRLTARETAPAASGIGSAAVIAAPQAIATPVILAPVPATPAIEATPQPEGGPAATVRHHERSQEGVRRRGTVKWFSVAKGYGFLRGDDGQDAFVHVSAIASAGLRTLVPGQTVEYELRRNAKGLHAVSLTLPDPVTLRPRDR